MIWVLVTSLSHLYLQHDHTLTYANPWIDTNTVGLYKQTHSQNTLRQAWWEKHTYLYVDTTHVWVCTLAYWLTHTQACQDGHIHMRTHTHFPLGSWRDTWHSCSPSGGFHFQWHFLCLASPRFSPLHSYQAGNSSVDVFRRPGQRGEDTDSGPTWLELTVQSSRLPLAGAERRQLLWVSVSSQVNGHGEESIELTGSFWGLDELEDYLPMKGS